MTTKVHRKRNSHIEDDLLLIFKNSHGKNSVRLSIETRRGERDVERKKGSREKQERRI
jgi:hypothetical protein